jgi:hypothetical protein
MIAKPCLDGFLQEQNQNMFELIIQPSDNPASERGTGTESPRRYLLQQAGSKTWGNLLEVENAFCSRNLISRVLSHIACTEHNAKTGKDFESKIYLAHYDAKMLTNESNAKLGGTFWFLTARPLKASSSLCWFIMLKPSLHRGRASVEESPNFSGALG